MRAPFAAASLVALLAALPALAAGDLQGLTAQEADALYHVPEGSEGLPFIWLLALESPVTHKPFLEHADRFGLLSDPKSRLPVGFSEAVPVDLEFAGVRMAGATCAACHVGEVRHGGQSMRIIGGPSMFNAAAFGTEVGEALQQTAKHPDKLMHFVQKLIALEKEDKRAVAHAVPPASAQHLKNHLAGLIKDDGKGSLGAEVRAHLGQPASKTSKVSGAIHAFVSKAKTAGHDALSKLDPKKRVEAIEHVLAGLRHTAAMLENRVKVLMLTAQQSKERTVKPGAGRVDAFGTAMHRLYSKQGVPAPYSPVSFPEVWDAARTTWYHYDGNTDSIVERNAGNARGLGFVYDPKSYASSLLPRSIHSAESTFWKTKPPVWPQPMLGALDPAKVAKGEQIFKQACAGCHVDKTFELVDLAVIGTDPLRAKSTQVEIQVGKVKKAALLALVEELEGIVQTAYKREKVTADEAAKFRFGRPAKATWRVTGKYKIPSLRGVWATAPYLHNGSVPSLHALLTPPLERPKKFLVGSYEFDPANVGYVTKASDPSHFEYDTSLPGNHNSGHEFGTKLGEPDKLALVEYLKTL